MTAAFHPSANSIARKSGRSALGVVALCAALAVLLSACGGETQHAPQETAQTGSFPPADPPLYEIARQDGAVEGWLLGTIHALPSGVEWRTEAITQVVDKADLLLVEVKRLDRPEETARAFAELSQTSGLPPLSDRVSAQLRPDLEAMIAKSDFSSSNFVGVEDWASALMLAQVDAPGDPRNGVDRALIADFAGRDIRGFETARSQLGIFDRLAPEDQRVLLSVTVQEWADTSRTRDRLLRAWLRGDTAALEAASVEGIMADPEIRAALLVERNTAWMERLSPMLEQEPMPLIAVGAAHLLGPDGLVAMLGDAGYSVRRLQAP